LQILDIAADNELLSYNSASGQLQWTTALTASTTNISVSGTIWGGTLSGFTIDDDLNSITNIDGDNIKNDTIDDDSIDFGDVTCADITTTDCGAITSTATSTLNAITSPGGMDIIFNWSGTTTSNVCRGACY
jgi:hypothetical protein